MKPYSFVEPLVRFPTSIIGRIHGARTMGNDVMEDGRRGNSICSTCILSTFFSMECDIHHECLPLLDSRPNGYCVYTYEPERRVNIPFVLVP
jgi:hypothetical protein